MKKNSLVALMVLLMVFLVGCGCSGNYAKLEGKTLGGTVDLSSGVIEYFSSNAKLISATKAIEAVNQCFSIDDLSKATSMRIQLYLLPSKEGQNIYHYDKTFCSANGFKIDVWQGKVQEQIFTDLSRALSREQLNSCFYLKFTIKLN